MVDVSDLENSIDALLQQADLELKEKQIQEERQQRIALTIENLTTQFSQLVQRIESKLVQYDDHNIESGDSVPRKRLEEKKTELLANLEEVELLAAEIVDEELLKKEDALIEQQVAKEMLEWRTELKDDLVQTIKMQQNFFDATEAALVIKPYIQDLREINAINEVTQILVDQINNLSTAGVAAKHRRTDEETIAFIADKAIENRSRCNRPRDTIKTRQTRKNETPPTPYRGLSGKVVIAGGHSKLYAHIVKHLRGNNVEIVWAVANAKTSEIETAVSQVATADLVLIITGYASHRSTEKIHAAAKAAEIPMQMIQTRGTKSVLEAIVMGLQTQKLTTTLGTRKRA